DFPVITSLLALSLDEPVLVADIKSLGLRAGVDQPGHYDFLFADTKRGFGALDGQGPELLVFWEVHLATGDLEGEDFPSPLEPFQILLDGLHLFIHLRFSDFRSFTLPFLGRL